MTSRSSPHVGNRDFPLATVAAYGPDNTCATKLVASVLLRREDREPPVMRTWTSEAADVRGAMVRETRERRFPIDDVAEATAWWARRAHRDDDADSPWDDEDGLDDSDGGSVEAPEPYRAPPKVGRNEPCRCGSGRKYKKCCGQ